MKAAVNKASRSKPIPIEIVRIKNLFDVRRSLNEERVFGPSRTDPGRRRASAD